MEKLTVTGDLAKAFKGLVGHFKKAAAHHDSLHKTHDAMSKVHVEHAAFHKGHADAMDEGDVHKASAHQHAAFHKASADHHAAKASFHKAHAEHNAAMADAYDVSDKGASVVAEKCAHNVEMTKACTDCKREEKKETSVAANIPDLEKGVNNALTDVIGQAFDNIRKSDDFKKLVEEAVGARLKSELAKMIVPDNVAGAIPDNEEFKKRLEERGLHVVPRNPLAKEESEAATDIEKLDPELRKLVQTA